MMTVTRIITREMSRNETSRTGRARELPDATGRARRLQKNFEAGLPDGYRDAACPNRIQTIVRARRASSQGYVASRDFANAAFELCLAAHCLEGFAEYLHKHGAERALAGLLAGHPPISLFKEALELRYQAINWLKNTNARRDVLALDLSHTSKTLTFMRREFPKRYDTPEVRGRIIAYRREAAPIFESCKQFRDADFEHFHLRKLFLEMARNNPVYYREALAATLKSIEVLGKYPAGLRRVKETYTTAAWLCGKIAASSTGEDRTRYREMANKYASEAEYRRNDIEAEDRERQLKRSAEMRRGNV
jgi:hypothetical protein